MERVLVEPIITSVYLAPLSTVIAIDKLPFDIVPGQEHAMDIPLERYKAVPLQ